MESPSDVDARLGSDRPYLCANHQHISENEAGRWMMHSIAQQPEVGTARFLPEASTFVADEEARKIEMDESNLWSEAFKTAAALRQQVEEYQRDLKKRVPGINVIDPRTASWSDVKRAIEEGALYYETQAVSGGIKGILRKGFRALGKNSNIFEAWLRFLPQGNTYISPLCASFQVILTVARKIDEVRADLLMTLSLIGDELQFIQEFLDIYQDRSVKEAAAALYTSILHILQLTMKFIVKNPFKKVTEAVLKLDRYGASVEECLANMKACKQRFQERARAALHREVRGISQAMIHMHLGLEEMTQKLEDIDQKDPSQFAALFMNALHSTLLENQKRGDDDTYRKAVLARHKSESVVRSNELWEIVIQLGYDKERIREEILDCFSYSTNFGSDEQDSLAWIKETSKFEDWATAFESRVLLLECDEKTTLPTSYVSFLCAEIAHTLSIVEGAFALTHFCGLRLQNSGGSGGARDMMLSFIGQMISQWPKSWDAPWIEETVLDDLKEGDLSALQRAFRALVSSCPKGSLLYILIDAVELLELPDRRDESMQTLKHLVQLVLRPGRKNGVLIKLLLTTPNRTTIIADSLEPQKVLYVPEARD